MSENRPIHRGRLSLRVHNFHLIHWGQVTHICVGNVTIIGSDNGSSPSRRQAIIWTNAGILLIGPWGTNFTEILIKIYTFSFKKMHLKMSSAELAPILSRPQCVNYAPETNWKQRREHKHATYFITGTKKHATYFITGTQKYATHFITGTQKHAIYFITII